MAAFAALWPLVPGPLQVQVEHLGLLVLICYKCGLCTPLESCRTERPPAESCFCFTRAMGVQIAICRTTTNVDRQSLKIVQQIGRFCWSATLTSCKVFFFHHGISIG